MRPYHVQVVDVTQERRVARSPRSGKVSARPPRQGHELLSDGVDARHAGDRCDFW